MRGRSRKDELADLRERLRSAGHAIDRIADQIREDYHVNVRVAYRLARGLTQQQVADRWNERWPSAEAAKTGKHISYWEAWPAPSGRPPSLKTLGRLAIIYGCQPGDLLDRTDYSRPSPPDRSDELADAVQTGTSLALAGSRDVLAPDQAQPDQFLPYLTRQLTNFADLGPTSARQRDAIFRQLIDYFITWAHTMDRRALLRQLGWAATSAAAAPIFDGTNDEQYERLVAVLQQPSRVDGTVIDTIEEVLWRCMRQDDTLGPQAALDTVLAQRNLASAMLAGCPDSLRPRLLSVFANLSRYAGWLAFDMQDFEGANYYYEQARTAAHEAQNTGLGAMVLCNLSHLATWQHRPRVGIDHAVAAQAWANQTDDMPLRAYAADVAARAYATDHQTRLCLDHLDQARGYIAAASGPTLVHFYNTDLLGSVQGLCLLTLGQPTRAVEHASQSLTALDPTYVRNVAFNTVYLGRAHLAARNIDAATHSLADAADLASRNRSPRLIRQIQDLRRDLVLWTDPQTGQDIEERLRTYGLL